VRGQPLTTDDRCRVIRELARLSAFGDFQSTRQIERRLDISRRTVERILRESLARAVAILGTERLAGGNADAGSGGGETGR